MQTTFAFIQNLLRTQGSRRLIACEANGDVHTRALRQKVQIWGNESAYYTTCCNFKITLTSNLPQHKETTLKRPYQPFFNLFLTSTDDRSMKETARHISETPQRLSGHARINKMADLHRKWRWERAFVLMWMAWMFEWTRAPRVCR